VKPFADLKKTIFDAQNTVVFIVDASLAEEQPEFLELVLKHVRSSPKRAKLALVFHSQKQAETFHKKMDISMEMCGCEPASCLCSPATSSISL
jgi:hypothetical protein